MRNGCPADARTINTLANKGDCWQTIMWAIEHGCPLDDEAVRAMVSWDQLEILQWAHSNGYLSKHSDDGFSELILRMAVKKTRLDTLRWCAEVGMNFNHQGLCERATRRTNAEMLQLLFEQRAPRDSTLLKIAATKKRVHIFDWLFSNTPLWKVWYE